MHPNCQGLFFGWFKRRDLGVWKKEVYRWIFFAEDLDFFWVDTEIGFRAVVTFDLAGSLELYLVILHYFFHFL
jgi:hypothetical protein